MKVKVKRMGINGEGIAYLNKKAIFIENALENEVVDIEIAEDKKNYSIGKVKEIVVKSKDRVEPICPHFEKCGGCNLMHLNYLKQLEVKRELLQESLSKYCGYKGKIEDTVISSKDLYYRNKCNIPFVEFKGKLANGFYQTNSNIYQTIDKCYIHSNKLEKLRKDILNVLNKYHCKLYSNKEKSGYRQLVIRGFSNSFQVVLVTGNDTISEKIINDLANLENLSSLYQCINTSKNPVNLLTGNIKLLFGSKDITFTLGKYNLQLSPTAFFQLNQYTALNIYQKINELIKDKQNLIVEAYCGIGAISLFLSSKAERIVGIDIDKSAIEAAKLNVKLNEVDNVSFKVGDATDQLEKLMKESTIDTLVVDPPRVGIDDKLLNSLANSDIKQIIYVSCNIATLAKNIKVLSSNYKISKVIPFDMFPQTAHVETIVLLSKR